MTPAAVDTGTDVVRGRCMGRNPVTDDAVVCRGNSAPEMAPGTVPLSPVPLMRPGRRFVMAAYTVVLPVAAQASLPVPCGLEPVTPHPPDIGMVAGRPGAVALDTVVAVMADITGRALLTRLVPVEIDKGAVKPDPVSLVGIGHGKGNASLFSRHIGCAPLCRGFFGREGSDRSKRKEKCTKCKGNDPSPSVPIPKNHSAPQR
jgi:hypothetical protein